MPRHLSADNSDDGFEPQWRLYIVRRGRKRSRPRSRAILALVGRFLSPALQQNKNARYDTAQEQDREPVMLPVKVVRNRFAKGFQNDVDNHFKKIRAS